MEVKVLDLKDRKILYILSQEARTPPSVIAKQVGLSKDAVKYRIRRMEKQKVIYNYITDIDTSTLDHYGYDIFMRFNIPPDKEKRIADYFNHHPNIIWSCSLSGKWNYFAEVMCSSNNEFHDITRELSERFANQLEDYEFYMVGTTYRITQIIEAIHDGKGINLKDIVEPTEFPGGERKVKLDATEKKILGVMAERATLPIHVIARRAGISPEIVRYRLRKMKKEGVILRNTAVIDYQALGFDEYIILIKMRNLTGENEDKLRMRIQNTSSIKYAYRALGEQVMFGLVTTRDLDELEQLVKLLRADFFDIIRSIDYLHITEHQRFTFFPDILRK